MFKKCVAVAGTQGYGLVVSMMEVLVSLLDLMILNVFFNLNFFLVLLNLKNFSEKTGLLRL